MGRTARIYPSGKYILRKTSTADEDKAYPLYLYYYCDGKQIRHPSGIYARRSEWNDKSERLDKSYGSDFMKKNDSLVKKKREVDSLIFEYVEKNSRISPDVIKAFLNKDKTLLRKDKGIRFLVYAREVLKKRYEQGKIRVSTYKNAETNINQFEKYLKSVHEVGSDLFIGDITEDIVRDFMRWELQRKRKLETVMKYQETISKVCWFAAQQGFLPKATAQVIAGIGLERCIVDDSHRTTIVQRKISEDF